jgi:hypothetical protein
MNEKKTLRIPETTHGVYSTDPDKGRLSARRLIARRLILSLPAQPAKKPPISAAFC